ncbi:MAG: MobA/MobL family protein [Rhodospirillales bacterium]
MPDTEDKNRGHYLPQEEQAVRAGLYFDIPCERWGAVGGRRARTFHIHLDRALKAPATDAQTRKAGASAGADIDYLNRMADFADRTDLVASGGRDAEEMRAILSAVDKATVRKNGRVALTLTMELPRDLDKPAWIRIAETLAEDIEETARPTHWVIHCDPAVHNPHIHLVAAARPIRNGRVTREGVRGRPAEEPIIWNTKEKVREQRRRAAQIINRELKAVGLDFIFHPGRLEETGITRKAKRRTPARAWYKDGQRDRDPHAVARARQRHAENRNIPAQRRAAEASLRQEAIQFSFDNISQAIEEIEARNFDLKDPFAWAEKCLIDPARAILPRERNEPAKLILSAILEAKDQDRWPKSRKEMVAYLKDEIAPAIRAVRQVYPATVPTPPQGQPESGPVKNMTPARLFGSTRTVIQQLERRNAILQEELEKAMQRSEDDMPATAKQLNYLNDLLKKTKTKLPDSDEPLTKGQVGTWIRTLQQRFNNQRRRPPHERAGRER